MRQPDPASVPPEELESSRPTLLLVEDDHELRETLREFLGDYGFAVACAGNGREALDYLATSPRPCVVLLDLMMPVMNGWEFREQQIRDERLSDIPVVIVSAVGRAEVTRDLVADAWLGKPIDTRRLLGMLARYGCA